MSKFRLGAIFLSLVLSPPAWGVPVPGKVRLHFVVNRDAKPALVVEAIATEGQQAVIEVLPSVAEGDAIQLRATAVSVEHPRRRPGQWVQVSVQLFERNGQDWVLRGEPWMVVPLQGEDAAFAPETSSTASIGSGSAKPGLELTLNASTVSEAGIQNFKRQCDSAASARGIQPQMPIQGRCCVDCGRFWVCCANSCCGIGGCGCCSGEQ